MLQATEAGWLQKCHSVCCTWIGLRLDHIQTSIKPHQRFLVDILKPPLLEGLDDERVPDLGPVLCEVKRLQLQHLIKVWLCLRFVNKRILQLTILSGFVGRACWLEAGLTVLLRQHPLQRRRKSCDLLSHAGTAGRICALICQLGNRMFLKTHRIIHIPQDSVWYKTES